MKKLGVIGAFIVIGVLALPGCGKEVGRIPLHGEGQGATVVNVTAGKKLALWTSLDVKYTGTLVAKYEVELEQNGTSAKAECNPLDVNVKTNSVETHINDQHRISWQGKMHCEVTPATSGPATVRTKFVVVQRPTPLTFVDNSLVIKE